MQSIPKDSNMNCNLDFFSLMSLLTYLSLVCLVLLMYNTGIDYSGKNIVSIAILSVCFVVLCIAAFSKNKKELNIVVGLVLSNMFLVALWIVLFFTIIEDLVEAEYFITHNKAFDYIGEIYKIQSLFDILSEKYGMQLAQTVDYQLMVDSLTSVANISPDSKLAYINMQDKIIAFDNAVLDAHTTVVNFKEYLQSVDVSIYNVFSGQVIGAIRTFDSLSMVNETYLSYLGKEVFIFIIFSIWFLLNVGTLIALGMKD